MNLSFMIKRTILFIFLSLISLQISQAQRTQQYTSKNKKAIEYYVESTNYFIRRQYGPAIELLNASVRKDGDFAEAHLRLSKIYQMMGDQERMQHHLQKVVKSQYDNPSFTEAHYLLAEKYFEEARYEEARKLAEHVMSMERAHKLIKDDCRYLLDNIIYTQENMDKPVAFQPVAVGGGINQLALQYFPVLTVDQQSMIFTGRVGAGPQYDEDIYISKKTKEGNWGRPESLSDNINSPANQGTCTISADGRTLIFTACQDRSGYGSCDLFISYKVGDDWSVPKNLGPQVNGKSWESQPSLSADGKTLYFVSDRAGGLGRRDIYVSYRKDGEWCKAENLGKTVNTPRDEVSPFIHVNGQTLYFASDGLPGFGKFDLYVSEKEESWTKPKNLGYPINTKEDQASLFITADGKDAYYSFEKRQGEHYVSSIIYTFEIPEAIRIRNRSSYVEGIVYDAETRQPIGATVELIDRDNQQKISDVTADPKNGEYLMVLTEGADYALYVDKEGYLFQSLSFNYSEQAEKKIQEPVHIDIYLQPITKGKETVLNNIFFDTDKYEIKDISKPELNKVAGFLKDNPEISISINGHTDNQGGEAYNKELSTKRAKAVYQYLIASGISEERLKYQGFGQSKPIASNDTQEGRQKNRRIAFEIL
jgi:outer membrane protein OmpA-like peptidoglycan-associated protein